jgi:hypothetical protein
MDGTWVPVAFAAVIILGAVGGSLAQMVLKELLPLLRTIAEQRSQVRPPDVVRVPPGLEARIEQIEADQQSLREENAFLRNLLMQRSGSGE